MDNLQIIKLSIIIFLSSYSLPSNCDTLCKSSNPFFNFNKVSGIIETSWKSCNLKIKEKCNKTMDFCKETICELTYEDWENMKPQSNCLAKNGSLNRICKILFSTTVCKNNKSGSLTVEPRLLLYKSIAVLALFQYYVYY